MPDFSKADRFAGVKQLISQYGNEYGIMAGVACTLFELAWYLRGMETVLMDMVANKDFMHGYLDRLMHWIEVAGRTFVKLGVDIIWIGDDFGTQDRMLIKPELFREFFKPRYAKLFQEWKTINPNVKIAFHSDGYIYPIIGDLIEVGLDILNPVQPECNDLAEIGRQYGEKLSFWGGIGTQTTMPYATPQEVKEKVTEVQSQLGRRGGLLIAPSHILEPEVPWENVLAFVEAVRGRGEMATNAEDAIANMRVIDAVYEQAGLQRRGT
jgi:uroporphyrinogen decarboxylase